MLKIFKVDYHGGKLVQRGPNPLSSHVNKKSYAPNSEMHDGNSEVYIRPDRRDAISLAIKF